MECLPHHVRWGEVMASPSKSTFDPNQVAAKVRVDTLTQQAGLTRSTHADVAKQREENKAAGLSLSTQVAKALAQGIPADTLSATRETCRVCWNAAYGNGLCPVCWNAAYGTAYRAAHCVTHPKVKPIITCSHPEHSATQTRHANDELPLRRPY